MHTVYIYRHIYVYIYKDIDTDIDIILDPLGTSSENAKVFGPSCEGHQQRRQGAQGQQQENRLGVRDGEGGPKTWGNAGEVMDFYGFTWIY